MLRVLASRLGTLSEVVLIAQRLDRRRGSPRARCAVARHRTAGPCVIASRDDLLSWINGVTPYATVLQESLSAFQDPPPGMHHPEQLREIVRMMEEIEDGRRAPDETLP